MILTQLLDNARRYSVEGSAGTRLTAYRHDAFVHIEVIDTGMGIPPDQQSLLFTRFHRVEGNNSPERGLGLGLMITKYLVELQGGTVWAHSQLGQGSTFGFSIPIAHER
jgi:signal transduction histidine kinase